MVGGYGIAQGINQGMQTINQGLKDRFTIQQEAEKQAAYLKTQDLVQQSTEQQIEQSKLQIQEMKTQIAKRDAFDVLSGYEQSGDASILNTVKDNPMMANLLSKMNISSFNNIKDYSEEKLQSLGVTPEMLQDKTKRIVIVNRPDGSTVAMDMMPVYASSGFLPKLGEQKLNQLTLEKTQAEATKATTETNSMINWLTAHPDKTVKDYEAIGKLDLLLAKSALGLGGGGPTAEQRNLQAITDLKMKVDNGTATPEEVTKYNVYLTQKGGTTAAKNEAVSQDINFLNSKNINLNDLI